MIRFRCESCKRKIGVPDEYAGKAVRCPQCKQPANVPASSTVAPSSPNKVSVSPTKKAPPPAAPPRPVPPPVSAEPALAASDDGLDSLEVVDEEPRSEAVPLASIKDPPAPPKPPPAPPKPPPSTARPKPASVQSPPRRAPAAPVSDDPLAIVELHARSEEDPTVLLDSPATEPAPAPAEKPRVAPLPAPAPPVGASSADTGDGVDELEVIDETLESSAAPPSQANVETAAGTAVDEMVEEPLEIQAESPNLGSDEILRLVEDEAPKPARPAPAKQPAAPKPAGQKPAAPKSKPPPVSRPPPVSEPIETVNDDPLDGLEALDEPAASAPAGKAQADADAFDPLLSLASAPVSVATCRACKKEIPIDSKKCPHCKAVVKQAAAVPAPAKAKARAAGGSASRGRAGAVADGSTITPGQVYLSALDPHTFETLLNVGIPFVVYIVVNTFVIAVVNSTGVAPLVVGTSCINMIVSLWFTFWFYGHCLGLIQRFASDNKVGVERVGGLQTFAYVLVVGVIAFAPMMIAMCMGLAADFGFALAKSQGGSPPGFSMFAMLVGFVWGVLYQYMGLAVAAVESSINPIRVIGLVFRTFPVYVGVFAISGLLMAGAIGVFIGVNFGLQNVGIGTIIAFPLGALTATAVMLYAILAGCAMMGMLMRRQRSREQA